MAVQFPTSEDRDEALSIGHPYAVLARLVELPRRELPTDLSALPPERQEALALIGAWSDLDWDEMIDALDEIRHSMPPRQPLDDGE